MLFKKVQKIYKILKVRLHAISKHMQQNMDLLMFGVEKGVVLPKIPIQDIHVGIVDVATSKWEESEFYQPFLEFPTSEEFSLEVKEKVFCFSPYWKFI